MRKQSSSQRNVNAMDFDVAGWWNGRHAGLKNQCSKECESSNLSPATKGLSQDSLTKVKPGRELDALTDAGSMVRSWLMRFMRLYPNWQQEFGSNPIQCRFESYQTHQS